MSKTRASDEFRQEFALRLKTLMESRGLGPDVLAYTSGASHSGVQGHLSGKVSPSLHMTLQYARALNVPVRLLIPGEKV